MKKLSPVSIDDTNSHCSVPCVAHFVVPPRAAYLKNAQEVDARGIAIFAFPPLFHEAIENLFYQEWERQTLGNDYQLSHEAVFTTLNSVNRRVGESLEMLVQTSDDAAFVAHGFCTVRAEHYGLCLCEALRCWRKDQIVRWKTGVFSTAELYCSLY